MPELRDVSTDQQNQGLAANLVIDRDTASRLGITAAAIDQVLYDAFGQREVSTMYTGAQPVLRGDGSRSAVSAQPRLAERHLHQGQQRCGRAASVPNTGAMAIGRNGGSGDWRARAGNSGSAHGTTRRSFQRRAVRWR